MTDKMAQKGLNHPERFRIAAEHRWANPSGSWEATAAHVGISNSQLKRWRKTEQWEIAFREAGTEYMEKLAPAAVHALVKAWAKGNPAGALDVLRSFGFLRAPISEVTVRHETVTDVDAEIIRLFGEIRGDRSDP